MTYQTNKFFLISLLLAICGLTGCYPLFADGMESDAVLPKVRQSLPSFIKPFIAQNTQLTWDVVSGPASAVSFSNDGTVTISAAEEIVVRSQQTVSTNFFLEVTLPTDFGKSHHLPYIGLHPYPINPSDTRLWGINCLGNHIRVDGQSQLYPAAPGDRIAMEARDGVVRYYKNHSGANSEAFYVSRLPPITQGSSHHITLLKPIGGWVGDQWVAKNITLTQ